MYCRCVGEQIKIVVTSLPVIKPEAPALLTPDFPSYGLQRPFGPALDSGYPIIY